MDSEGQGTRDRVPAFEEGNELKSLEQLRAFIKRYDVEYPVLFAGDLRLWEVMAEIQRLLAEQ